jgi:hypothetical protein
VEVCDIDWFTHPINNGNNFSFVLELRHVDRITLLKIAVLDAFGLVQSLLVDIDEVIGLQGILAG